jgi:hypothetical protein
MFIPGVDQAEQAATFEGKLYTILNTLKANKLKRQDSKSQMRRDVTRP